MSTPDVPIPPQWELDLKLFDLHESTEGKTERTIEVRKNRVSLLARWLVNEAQITDPADVKRSHMQLYMAKIIEKSRFSGAQSAYNDLKVWWDWFTEEAHADPDDKRKKFENPMAGIDRPKGERFKPAEVPVLTQAQFAALLKAANGSDAESRRDLALILLLATTGLRHNECRLLDIADVDVSTRIVGVRRETAKFSKARQTVISPEATAALIRWMRARAAIAREGEEALFVTVSGGKRGRRISYDTLGRILKIRGEQARITGLHPHMMRHLWTHTLLSAGMSEGDVMAMAGWTTAAQIHKTYGAALASQRALAAGLAMPVDALLRRGRAS